MNILGEYVLVSLGFVLGAMIEFALVNYFKRMNDKKLKQNGDGHDTINNRSVKKIPKFSRLRSKIRPINKTENQSYPMKLTKKMELMAFFLHISSFLFYNVFYWIKNLN